MNHDDGIFIDPDTLDNVNGDLASTRDAIREHIAGLRSRFDDLGVSTTNLTTLTGVADEIDDILPDMRERQRLARETADQQYGGDFSGSVELDSEPVPTDPTDVDPTITTTAHGDGVTYTWSGDAPSPGPDGGDGGDGGDDGGGFSVSSVTDWVGDTVGDTTDWLRDKWDSVSDWAGDQMASVASWWEEVTDDIGTWLDENLADLREWIGQYASVFRVLSVVLKVIGWILVVVGAVIIVLSAIVSVFGITLPVTLPSAGVGWMIMSFGFGFISAGDFVDRLADWGEGKIDGQELVQGAAADALVGLLSVVGFGAIGGGLKQLIKRLPDSWKRNIADWIERMFRNRPGPGNNPGIDTPLVRPPGGVREYEYRNPAVDLAGRNRPTADELDDIGRPGDYPAGSDEHMLARWKEYQQRKPNGWSWERWRDNYIDNMGRKNKGEAYEEAFWSDQGFTDDAYQRNHDIDVNGQTRNYDIVDEANQVGYELKSGNDVKPAQVAKDQQLIQAGWDIVYVFAERPNQKTIEKLENAGIQWEVWEGEGTPVN